MRGIHHAFLALGLLAAGGLLWGYWALFMSWNHGYASADFAVRETLVQVAGSLFIGLGLLIAMRQVRGRRGPERPQNRST